LELELNFSRLPTIRVLKQYTEYVTKPVVVKVKMPETVTGKWNNKHKDIWYKKMKTIEDILDCKVTQRQNALLKYNSPPQNHD
jgi:cytochrome b subunit of formate dehydrogenase